MSEIKRNGHGAMDMTQGSPTRLIVLFSLPLLAGNVLQQLYNMVDSVVVGNYVGSSALTAVGAGFSIMFLISSLFLGFSMGATIMIAQYVGAGDQGAVGRTVDTIYSALLVIIVPLTLLGVLASGPLLTLIRVPQEAYEQARTYCMVVLGGIVGTLGYNMNSGIMRGLGDSRTPLIFLFIANTVTGKLSELNKNRLGAITTVWSLAVVFFCITCMGKYAMTTTDTTSVWNMSYKPFIWFAVFGCVLLFLAMLSHLLDQLAAIIRGGGMGSAFLMLGIGLLGVALSVWVAVERLPGISAPAQGVIGMVYMFTMFFLGMPVAFALMGTSLVFIASLRGLTAALNLFGTAWFSTCSSYTWAPLMFFLLMGFLCFYSRFGEDLYRTARNWCGHFRGGLAIASVCACTALGAVVGDALVGCIAMMTIALPEMRRQRTDQSDAENPVRTVPVRHDL